jgi:hypothetical protein
MALRAEALFPCGDGTLRHAADLRGMAGHQFWSLESWLTQACAFAQSNKRGSTT